VHALFLLHANQTPVSAPKLKTWANWGLDAFLALTVQAESLQGGIDAFSSVL
jgi:hypothetical protein